VKAAILVGGLICAALAASLGASDLSKYRTGQEKIDHPVLVVIDEYRTWLIGVLTLLGAGPTLATAAAEGQRNRKKNRDLVVRYLQLVHERSFPHQEAGMSDSHRVSLFTPKMIPRHRIFRFLKKRVLQCDYRTGGNQPGRSWDIEREPSKLMNGLGNSHQERPGLVVQAWVLQATITVAPPIAGDQDDQQRYRREARMTDEIQRERSWPNAGMHAVPLLTGATEPLAILLVESNGIGIACSELKWDAKTMAILLGDKP